MALVYDLAAAVAAIKTNQATVAQAITDEITRVEATIAALKGQVGGGSVPDAAVQQAITDLQGVATNLTANAATLAGEDAAPAPVTPTP